MMNALFEPGFCQDQDIGISLWYENSHAFMYYTVQLHLWQLTVKKCKPFLHLNVWVENILLWVTIGLTGSMQLGGLDDRLHNY